MIAWIKSHIPIVMMAVGEGARYQAIQQIKDLGATNIIVRSVKPVEDNKQNKGQFLLNYGLTLADMERIAATVPTVTAVTPMREFHKDVRHYDRKLDARVVGVTPNYLEMNGLRLRATEKYWPPSVVRRRATISWAG